MKTQTDEALASYRFNDAAQGLYKFLWNEFCDWYLELVKLDMKEDGETKTWAQFVLYTVLRELLLLLHPIIPFVTAQIWQALPGRQDADIALETGSAHRPFCMRPTEAGNMIFLQEVISSVRTIRAELGINPAFKLAVLLRPASPEQAALLETGRNWLMALARLEKLDVRADGHIPKASASNVVHGCEVIVHLSGAVDFQAELARLDKELGKLEKERATLAAKLGNENFLARAPSAVVEQENARAADMAIRHEKLVALQKRFQQAVTQE